MGGQWSAAESSDEQGGSVQGGPHVVQLAASRLGGVPGATAYHTSVIVDGTEYFFDGAGINTTNDLGSHKMAPGEPTVTHMGTSKRSGSQLRSALSSHFGSGTYDLIRKNCNSFSDAALCYLLGTRLDPSYRQLERMGASNPGAVAAVSGGQYEPNPAAEKFDLEAVCASVDPAKMWKTPGQAVGGGEAALTEEELREKRLRRFAGGK
eukprot:TRINITY_DN26860_c0_g1_i1.p1 TRINITY_DN26860_c0_g1~~TRINITY_DN26860_c0_g1_i1.p1  ORF type:complete len:208 (+),score=67.21 TRINITY_DN26860_c0_g1_i1:101-724(+)